ncbi:hypothetical protein G4V62_05250 [Bacillaceae bacterium SIJ1]|nr:YlaH-like family protein [Litoribacterium kuwaitense]NGP44388.1 hypothetical protein [Litoribacterium kuwaitense]
MSPTAHLIFQQIVGEEVPIDEMLPQVFMLYGIIVILSILVYNLGFAKKLPVLKNVVIYALLFIGCWPLTFMAIGLPVAEALVVIAIIFGVYRFRMHKGRKQQTNHA